MTLIERGEQSAFVLGFALHGIEVMLDRLKRPAVLEQFLVRVVQAEGLTVYPTSPEEEREVVPLTQHLSLDFDDALHYYVADSLGLVLVSFDHDFDHTDITRMEPSAILNS
jgi:predicted nucleic acid-binding protein